MRRLEDANVGDPVLVHARGDVPLLRTVRAVTKRKVTLDDGTEWTMRGVRWGSSSSPWSTLHATAATEQDLARRAEQIAELQRRCATLRERIAERLDGASEHALKRALAELMP